MDFRSRLLVAIDNGLSCRRRRRDLALPPRRRSIGMRAGATRAPLPQGGEARSRRIEERAADVLSIWEMREDISLEELRVALADTG